MSFASLPTVHLEEMLVQLLMLPISLDLQHLRRVHEEDRQGLQGSAAAGHKVRLRRRKFKFCESIGHLFSFLMSEDFMELRDSIASDQIFTCDAMPYTQLRLAG